MKRLILAMLLVAMAATSAFAAGTVTPTIDDDAGNMRVITFTATADASDGSYPATSSGFAVDGAICRVIVDPDGTATPTDNYDATLTDKWGIDVMEGALANLDTTATTAVDYVPTVNSGGGIGCVVVRGPVTLTLTGNSVNSAVTVFHILVLR